MWSEATYGGSLTSEGRIYRFDHNAETDEYGVLGHCNLVCHHDRGNENLHNVWCLHWQLTTEYTDGVGYPRVGMWGEPIETVQARANAMIRAELEKVMQKLK